MTFVLDASITMAWFLNEPGPSLGDIVDRVVDEGAMVPRMWALEVANTFQMAIRRKRITAADRDLAFQQLRHLPIVVDPSGDALVWTEVVLWSAKHQLTAYDATYFELAVRLQVPLATNDTEFIAAARVEGIEVLPSAASAS